MLRSSTGVGPSALAWQVWDEASVIRFRYMRIPGPHPGPSTTRRQSQEFLSVEVWTFNCRVRNQAREAHGGWGMLFSFLLRGAGEDGIMRVFLLPLCSHGQFLLYHTAPYQFANKFNLFPPWWLLPICNSQALNCKTFNILIKACLKMSSFDKGAVTGYMGCTPGSFIIWRSMGLI